METSKSLNNVSHLLRHDDNTEIKGCLHPRERRHGPRCDDPRQQRCSRREPRWKPGGHSCKKLHGVSARSEVHHVAHLHVRHKSPEAPALARFRVAFGGGTMLWATVKRRPRPRILTGTLHDFFRFIPVWRYSQPRWAAHRVRTVSAGPAKAPTVRTRAAIAGWAHSRHQRVQQQRRRLR